MLRRKCGAWVMTVGSYGAENCRGGRATAPIEEICCEKIRGCSYRARGVPHPMSAMHAIHHSFGQPCFPKALNQQRRV
jgi:hypothetical protein